MIDLLIGLILIGVVLYLLQLIPMDATVKQIVRVVAILLIVLWVISVIFPGAASWRLR